MKEIWKPVKDYEGLYEVSSYGQVRSLTRMIKCSNIHNTCYNRIMKGMLLKSSLNSDNYNVVRLTNNKSEIKTLKVSRLVFIAFNGDIKYNYIIDHKDNNSSNDYLYNLQQIQQRLNTSKDKNKLKTSSKYTGVCFLKHRDKWKASIFYKYKTITLGSFKNEVDAATAYNEALYAINNNKPILKNGRPII